jgi:outer membrane protein W
MKLKDPTKLGVMLGAAILATILLLPRARADLVYEEDIQNAQQAGSADGSARAEDREALRHVLKTSKRAQDTVAAEPTQVVAQPIQTAPVRVAPAPVVEAPVAVVQAPAEEEAQPAESVQNMSKAELMRRQRMREELHNEDILQERLEQLRLRDEKARTDMVLGNPAAQAAGAVAPTGPAQPAPMKDEVVSAPITERPGQPQEIVVTPTVAATGEMTGASVNATSVSTAFDAKPSEDKTMISITPRIGVSSMNNAQGAQISARHSLGVGIGVGVSENLTFEAGYSYSEYGVAGLEDATTSYYRSLTANSDPNLETRAIKQNVFDLGLKLHFLGSDSKLRPYVLGGAAYGRSFVNYDNRVTDRLGPNNGLADDTEVSSYLGYLGTGFDVRLTKSVSIGAQLKYYTVLSARETQSVNSNAGFGGGYGATVTPGAYNGGNFLNSLVGDSIAHSSFYNVTAGVSFEF